MSRKGRVRRWKREGRQGVKEERKERREEGRVGGKEEKVEGGELNTFPLENSVFNK